MPVRREGREVQHSGVVRCSVVTLGACLLAALPALPACAQEPAPPAPTSAPTSASARSGSASPAPAGPAGPSRCPTTAAAALGWGKPTRESDFTGTTLPPDWHPYGPEPGHERRGVRTPAAITVGGGEATITGTADGTTGAMSWHPGQRYGRWEICVQSDPGDLHSVALLWPVAEDWPAGGEIDWMEIMDSGRQTTEFNLHYGADNQVTSDTVQVDSTQWNAYAVEWTPQAVTGYVNGRRWFSDTDPTQFPPRPMNMTVQLDYFGDAAVGSAIHLQWARQWALPESEPAQLSLAPGDPATGQPELFPQRTPRRLTS